MTFVLGQPAAAQTPGAQTPTGGERGVVIVDRRHVGGTSGAAAHAVDVADWLGDEGRGYCSGDARRGTEIRRAAAALLELGWQVVDVDLTHSQLATLYPTRKGGHGVNRASVCVSRYVLAACC